jgi:hypothetical protein
VTGETDHSHAAVAPGNTAAKDVVPKFDVNVAGGQGVIIGDGNTVGLEFVTKKVVLAPGVAQAAGDVELPTGGLSNLPRRPTGVFVGRNTHLAGLARAFQPATAASADTPGRLGAARVAVGQAVAGQRGVGKSELALQYAAARTVWGSTSPCRSVACADGRPRDDGDDPQPCRCGCST